MLRQTWSGNDVELAIALRDLGVFAQAPGDENKGVVDVRVYHDPDCGMYRGRPCNCWPCLFAVNAAIPQIWHYEEVLDAV